MQCPLLLPSLGLCHTRLIMVSEQQEYGLFIGDLDPEATASDIKHAFQMPMEGMNGVFKIVEPFLTVTGASVACDSTGRGRGFGFIFFSDEVEVLRALHDMNGRWILSRPSA